MYDLLALLEGHNGQMACWRCVLTSWGLEALPGLVGVQASHKAAGRLGAAMDWWWVIPNGAAAVDEFDGQGGRS